jgi:TPR repeat protein
MAAMHGNASAHYELRRMYCNGDGAWRDYAEAANWYRKAADKGLTGAKVELAFMQSKGQDIPVNTLSLVLPPV